MNRCAEQGIAVNHHAKPREMVGAEGKKKGKQATLEGAFAKAPGPRAFSRDDVLRAVAEFVVCDDQVRLRKT